MIMFCLSLWQAVEDTGSLLRVSDSAGSCNAGQTPTVKQVDGSGTLEISLKGRI